MSLEIPDKCPICDHELSIDDIDYQPCGDKIVSMLYCPKCSYKKKLDETYIEEDMEDDDDFDPMALLKDPDEDDEDEEIDESADMFPNGRDYDAEDEDGP